MATNSGNGNGSQLLLVGDTGGITVINPSTPLKRLNYFDGKFLRADDFDVEQRYLRQLVALSNQGLGPGVVYGYDTTLGNGDSIQIGPGLAIDPSGKVLLLQTSFSCGITDLIEASKKVAAKAPDASGKAGPGVLSDCVQVAAPPPVAVVPVSDIYVIVICSAEALCGQQDVYGVLCQDACISNTDRPYRLDGIAVRAIPLQLATPFPTSSKVYLSDDKLYLRSKVAHSWFRDERRKHPWAISRDGLLSTTWCLGAGYDNSCCEVPLAVVARAGATTLFLDAWIVRRERIDAPAKRYWQWKMGMRPWDVFIAQVLQFQCQLAGLLSSIVHPGSRAGDPCAEQNNALKEAAQFVDEVRSGLASLRGAAAGATLSGRPLLLSMSLTHISDLQDRLQTVLKTAATPSQPKAQILIKGGIIELPPAGYLPVFNGTSVSVNDQVRALLGEGLDLRLCITTADYIAHAVEEAQHMDRISLLKGLDDPSEKPRVDIWVPDGVIVASSTTTPGGELYAADLFFEREQANITSAEPDHQGAAREEVLDSGGTALYAATAGTSPVSLSNSLAERIDTSALFGIKGGLDSDSFIKEAATAVPFATTAATPRPKEGLWLEAWTKNEIKYLGIGGLTQVRLCIREFRGIRSSFGVEHDFNGTLSISDAVASGVNTLILIGTLIGRYRVAQESSSGQTTAENFQINCPAKLTYTGDASNGSIVLDVQGLNRRTSEVLRLTRSINAKNVTYDASSLFEEQEIPILKLVLTANRDVIELENRYHQIAEEGLDIIQAGLMVTEPYFKTKAEGLLFPSLPPGTEEFTIQAIQDWVAFTKRRETQCTKEAEKIPPAPPRSYRVFNFTSKNPNEDVRTIKDELVGDAAAFVQKVLKKLGEQRLVITFAGGSAKSQTDPSAVEADWKLFNPGKTIYFAAIGAVDETSQSLQVSRLRTFENAISQDSSELSGISPFPIIPYPESARPRDPDADGIMFFVTSTSEAQLVYAAKPQQWKDFLERYKQDLNAALNKLTPLGSASYAVEPSGEVSVEDSKVKAAYQPGNAVRESRVITSQADPDAYHHRNAAAKQIVKDLGADPDATPHYEVYSGTWSAETPSILVIEVVSTIE